MDHAGWWPQQQLALHAVIRQPSVVAVRACMGAHMQVCAGVCPIQPLRIGQHRLPEGDGAPAEQRRHADDHHIRRASNTPGSRAISAP